MTSELIASLIAEGDPLMPPDWNLEQEIQRCEQHERARRRCIEVFSSSPLYQAAAEKEPDYWNNFWMGIVR